MGNKFFFPFIILFGISYAVIAQDTLKTSTITHRTDSTVNKAPAIIQQTDSATSAHAIDTIDVRKHSPSIAGLASAILPGAGQFYNKKYWKIPVLYAGIAVDVYFIVSNYKSYQQFRQAYIANVSGDTNTTNPYAFAYSSADLLSIQQYYQKYYNLSIIIGGVIYALNILDAVVDAHLFYFDVTEKLSMQITPTVNPFRIGSMANAGGTGISLKLNF